MAPKTTAPKQPGPKKTGPKKAVAKRAVAKKPRAKKAAAKKPGAKQPSPASAAPSTAPQQRSLANVKAFFDRTLSVLDESDSAFAPTPGMFSTAQQVAHVAQTYEWFLDGAFRPEGFETDFAGMEQKVRSVTSLAQAKAWLERAAARVQQALQERPAADWLKPIAQNTIMGGAPRLAIVDGLADHTAHHRGALSVYARLRGKTPLMPYM